MAVLLRCFVESRKNAVIYRFITKLNNKNYIGSSTNLSTRFLKYFNIKKNQNDGRMLINLALLNYGYENFILDILEYYSKEDTLKIEQYYLDKNKPEYNILKFAGYSLGYKHTK